MAATQATRSAGSGTVPDHHQVRLLDERRDRRPARRLPARATRTTASDCRRQKSRQAGSPPAATPSATSTTRSPASSALARPSASTTPGVDDGQVGGEPFLQVVGHVLAATARVQADDGDDVRAGRVARGSGASRRCASGPPPGSAPSGRPAGPGRAARRRPRAAPR